MIFCYKININYKKRTYYLMKTNLLRQRIDVNTTNNEVINSCVNDLLIQNQRTLNETTAKQSKSINIEHFLNPAIYQYYAAYSAFLEVGDNTLAPPELIEIGEEIYMIEAGSRYLYKESSMHDTILRIEFNCIKIEDEILHQLDSEQIFKRRANKIQLKATYEQVHLLLDEK